MPTRIQSVSERRRHAHAASRTMAATRRSINMRMLYFDVPALVTERPVSTGRFECPLAEVAELADALASGASGRKAMKVRVLSSAPAFALDCGRRLPAVALAKAGHSLAAGHSSQAFPRLSCVDTIRGVERLCAGCGDPIAAARLAAKPFTKECARCSEGTTERVKQVDVTSHHFSQKPGLPRGYPRKKR